MGIAWGSAVDKRSTPEQMYNAHLFGQAGTQTKQPDLLDPLLVGENKSYMIQAYFPKDILNDILPDTLTIPDDATMARYYPETKLSDDAHPFMISICHGSNIHDVFTKRNVPEQEEIMFLFPVIYTDDNGDAHLCSYVPVLYLDSFWGVVGGLFYGCRKQYHPEMKHGEDAGISAWWSIQDIFDASFVMRADEDMETLPGFFEQTFSNPYVTLSYPLPFAKLVFFQVKVYPSKVSMATETFNWSYRGATMQEGEDTWSAYSEYYFTLSWPMNGRTYFGQ